MYSVLTARAELKNKMINIMYLKLDFKILLIIREEKKLIKGAKDNKQCSATCPAIRDSVIIKKNEKK